MSPNMFSVTITSNCAGSEASCIAALSTSMSSTWTSGYSVATSATTRRQRRDVSSTFALSTEVTWPRRERASSKPCARCAPPGVGWYSHVSKAVPSSRTPRGAEVEPSDELTDHEEVDVALEGGAQVRVDVELGAQLEHPLLRTDLGRVELRIADRRLQDRIGVTAGRERLLRERRARRPDRRSAEEVLLELEIGRELAQRALGHRHHLGPDAVAGQAHDAQASLESGHEECRHYKLGSAV